MFDMKLTHKYLEKNDQFTLNFGESLWGAIAIFLNFQTFKKSNPVLYLIACFIFHFRRNSAEHKRDEASMW